MTHEELRHAAALLARLADDLQAAAAAPPELAAGDADRLARHLAHVRLNLEAALGVLAGGGPDRPGPRAALEAALWGFMNPTGHTDTCMAVRALGAPHCSKRCEDARAALELATGRPVADRLAGGGAGRRGETV